MRHPMRNYAALFLAALLSCSASADVLKTITAGATDQSVTLKIIDSTDGTPETAVAFNTSGIDLEYWRHGANAAVDITEATQTVNGAHADGGFVAIGHGIYRLDLPDAAVAAGVTAVDVYGTVTGMIVLGGTVQLNTSVAQTGDAFARLGAPSGASISADIATRASQTTLNTVDDFLDTEMAAVLAAVDTEIASILDDTGTSGVVLAEVTTNCREVLGCDTQGTLSGTHSTTAADLGTNAPANDIAGMTLVIPSRNFSRAISSYNTSTGVATWDTATAVTLANADQYYLHATAPSTGGGSAPSAATIADAVLDEALSGHATAGSLGAAVSDILVDTSTTIDDLVDDLESRIGTPSNLGGGATLAANASDIEGQTDDIGVAGAGLTATDDAIMTRVGTPVGASISADVAGVESGISWNSAWDAEVESEVDDALGGGTGAALTAIPWNSAWDAEVQSESDDALVARDLHFLLDTTYDPTAEPAADSLFGDLTESDAGVTRFTANSLEQAPSGGGGVADWSSDERTAIRSILGVPASGTTPDAPSVGVLATIENQTDDIGTAGAGLSAVPWNAAHDAEVQSEVQDALNAYDPPTRAELTSDINGLNDISVADIRSIVVEDQGAITLGCMQALMGAVLTGDATNSGNTTTFEDASGAETRVVVTTAGGGTRTVTVTCPTY